MKDTVKITVTSTARPGASLFLWRGCALVVGPGIDSTPHAHFAAQLTLALDQPFRARLGAGDAWSETSAALFAPNQAHQIDSGRLLAHLFIDASQLAAGLVSSVVADYDTSHGFEAVRATLLRASTYPGAVGLEEAARAVLAWRDCAFPALKTDGDKKNGMDARIAQSLAWIATHAEQAVNGAQLAHRVHLSESRFTHLFRAQTGLPLSRYVLWTRLSAAVEAVAGGANTTEAAHLAGFSDLAHMSRTFRNTFGVVPSELQKMTIAFKRD